MRKIGIGGAIVLAAGRGQRLRPLSDVLPKPALPLPDGPVVGWALRLVAASGVSSIAVNTWWLADEMEDAARRASPAGLQCLFSREDTLMETAGGLALARDRGLLGDQGPVLVVNGDGVLNLDLAPLLVRHRESDDLVTMALLPHLNPGRWSRVLLDSHERVAAFLPPGTPDPGEAPFLYPGVMLVSRVALESLEVRPAGVAQALWQPASADGRLGGVVVSGHWREVGTPLDYLAAVAALLRNGLGRSEEAVVHPDAVVEESLIGPGVVIECGAQVSHAVVSHGAVIGENASVAHSVILGAVVIPAGGRVTAENIVGGLPSTST